MICESLGYFTPTAAAYALLDFKLGRGNGCEWYSDINRRRGLDLFDEEGLKQVTREVVEWSIQNRHHHKGPMADFRVAMAVIQRELKGDGPELASWF